MEELLRCMHWIQAAWNRRNRYLLLILALEVQCACFVITQIWCQYLSHSSYETLVNPYDVFLPDAQLNIFVSVFVNSSIQVLVHIL